VEGGDISMSSIDERVVHMKFDNAQFEAGIKTTLTSLEALNKGLQLQGATKGLSDLSSAAKNVNLSHIGQAVDDISNRFKALSVIAISALASITTQALHAGASIISSLTIDPIKQGLQEYETNLNAIQTILANTQAAGTNLKQVNAALNELNLYSDKTIYNFSEMARNIGTFTAAGVDLSRATASIKGIANLAALSGSNAQQASTAMYQLSQAIAAGRINLMDWNSVVNAGMGGTVFQRALANTAVAMGKIDSSAVKLSGKMKNVTIDGEAFRYSLQKGWLTADVLTKTLEQFTGDLSDAELASMGFTKTQIKAIQLQAKTAEEAATKVKTLSQLMGTLAESAGSQWAQTWQTIFGDFGEARTLFTNVNNVLGGFIMASGNARNKVLSDWKALGGRTVIIDAIANAFHALIAVVTPIKDAFREIFPATTGKQLYDLSVIIRDFTKSLIIGGETADNLRRTFAGFFAVLSIGWTIVKEGVKVVFDLFGMITKGSGGLLKASANVGDFLVNLKKFLVDGGKIHEFFQGLEKVIAKPIEMIREFVGWVINAAKGIDHDATPAVEGLHKALTPLQDLGHRLIAIWEGIKNVFNAIVNAISPVASAIKNFVLDVFKSITDSFGHIDYSSVLDGVNTGLIAGLVALFANFLRGGALKFLVGGGIFSKIKTIFDELGQTLKAFQLQVKAKALIQIAAAVAILTVSVVALSLIDSGRLTSALTGITVMAANLAAAMVILEKVGDSKGFYKMPFITGSMILLAGAVDLLAIAVGKMAGLNWNELARGLTGVTVVLGGLVAAVNLMPTSAKLFTTSLGMIAIAGAVKLLASAVGDFAGMSWSEMIKGLTGVVLALGAMVLVTKALATDKGGLLLDAIEFLLLASAVKILAKSLAEFSKLSWGDVARGLTALAGAMAILVVALDALPPTAILGGAGVLVTALGLVKVAQALEQMGKMSWGAIGKAVVALLGAMTIITAALTIIPPWAPLAAASIYITAVALLKVADVLNQMGAMSWSAIAKAVVALGAAMTIIAIGVTAMSGAIGGAAALIVIAGALAIFVPVLAALGAMAWGDVGKGLLILAASLTVLGVAGLVLGPVVPVLLGLGIAIALLGVAMVAAGVGVLAFATSLAIVAKLGAASADNIKAIVTTLLGLLPLMAQKLGEAVIEFAKIIANGGPAIVNAITTVLLSLMSAIDKTSPKIIDTLARLMLNLLNKMVDYVPKMTDAGLKILVGFLNGIANNIGKVVDAGVKVIQAYLKAIGDNLPKVIQSGVDLILKFINGLTKAINDNSAALGTAGGNLAKAIISGMANGLWAGVGTIVSAAKGVAQNALNAAMSALGINSPSKEFMKIGQGSSEGLAMGITKYSHLVEASATNVAKSALETVRSTIASLSSTISSEMDLSPTISPVLDLSKVKQGAGTLGRIMTATPLSVAASYSSATAAADGVSNNTTTTVDGAPATNGALVSYTQNNYSPKALSTADIYRGTKNQLSTAREAVAANADPS
jgi:tape measure domain-containing protein